MISALRALRLLRVLKLARIWHQFRRILVQIYTALIDVAVFLLLLCVYIFIFSLLGMELFAFSVYYDIDGELIMGKQAIIDAKQSETRMFEPADNFNNFGQSAITVFMLVIGDDWPQIATLYIRAQKESGFIYELSAYLYFILSLITGCIIL